MERIIGVLCLFALSDHLVDWKGQALVLDDAIFLSAGPSSLNVFPNTEAVFSCQTFVPNGSLDSLVFVKWFLNGNYLEDEGITVITSYDEVNTTTKLHTVRFQVEDENVELLNNSNITCRGFYDNVVEQHFELTNFSEPAVLLIQGILDAPEILNASIKNGSVSLHWKQPFILPGLGINYYLLNVTVEVSLGPNNVLTSNTTNQTEEEQSSFLEPYEGICNVYNICVQVVSAAGIGDPACIMNFFETKKPRKISVEEIGFKVDFMPDTSVISTYTFAQDYCFQRRAENFALFAAFRTNRPNTLMNSTKIPNSDQPISLVMKLPQSQSTEVDNVTIVLTNDAGSIEFDPISTELLLSCVHSITFPDDHSIGCSFVSGCVASGCKVVIECAQLSTAEQKSYIFNLTKKNDSLVSDSGLLPCHNIANCTANLVIVYAIYNGGHSDVPDVTHSNISIPACTTSTTMMEVDPGSTHPSQSSDQKNSKDIYIGIGTFFAILFLIGSCIAVAVLIYCLIRRKCQGEPVQDPVSLKVVEKDVNPQVQEEQLQHLEVEDLTEDSTVPHVSTSAL